MVDNSSSNQNNDSNNQNNSSGNQNTSNNSASYSGGGKTICLGADNGCHQEDCTAIQKGLEDCGNTVKFTCIDPNQESHMKGSGADFNVFFCNGVGPATMWSFAEAIKAGSLPFTIFGFVNNATYHDQSETDSPLHSMENLRNMAWDPEWDANFMSDSSTATMKSGGEKTLGEWLDKNTEYIGVCMGGSPEELAQQICSGSCGGGASTGGNSGGAGTQIKDKTFERCIKRICAATDSVFLVENNAAVLFPYTDWMAFTLRQQIKTITSKQMDPDLFEIEYNTDGFYNKVTTVFGADEEESSDEDAEASTKTTTKDKKTKTTTKNKKTKNNDNNNTKTNSATNSGTEEKTKKGNTTKTRKSMPTGGTQISEQYDPLVKIYGELEKKVTTNFPDEETAQYVTNALLIQYIRDFNNSCRVRSLYTGNIVGGTFYVVENPNTKETNMYYLNSYVIYKEKDQPITIDMEFKYGPEGAEEVLDYQPYGASTGGGAANTGSSTEDQIWKDAAKCKWAQDQPDCSTNDPKTAKKHYDDYTAQGTEVHFDCFGMSAYLYYRFNYETSTPARIIGTSDHKVIELYKNNEWYKPIEEYRQLDELFRYDDATSSPNSPVILDPPNNPSGGSSSNSSSNSSNNSSK